MIEEYIIQATQSLINQQQGKIINKSLHTQQVAAKFIPNKVLDTINSHRKAAALSSLVPGVGMVGTLASVWHMYYSINQIIGISFDKNLVKSIATGIASNMAGFFTASFILDKIPFANFLNAPIMYGATCVQGFVYIKILTALNSSSGTDVDTVIRNVISENAVLIKKLLSEFLGSSNQQTHKAVSIYTLETRRTEKANKTKKEAISNVKYMLVAAILGVIGVWYCSTNEAYTRDVTDLWITSFTSTSWNVWWYLWGGIMLISTLIFFGTLTGACFGYAEYFKIKSTPLSSFAEKNEYLSDNQSLETLVKKELGCKRWNKVITILSHLLIGMVAGLLTYLFYIYCIGHSSSEMITVKYAFMDARSEEDTHYVWYIMAGSGILSAVLGLYNIYMFFKSFFK